MTGALNSAAEIWFRHLASASFQATLLALLVIATVFVGRRWSPATRYALLLVALVKFAIPPTLPLPTGLFSHFNVNGTSRSLPAITHVPVIVQEALWPPESGQVEPLPGPVEAAPERSATARTLPSEPVPSFPPSLMQSLTFKTWLLIAHLIGACAILLKLLLQKIRMRRLLFKAERADESGLIEAYANLCRQMKIRKQPALLLSKENNSPMAFGVWNPTVILPRVLLEKMSLAEIRLILGHELAHHKRGDLLLGRLQIAISVVWWFNPVYWILSRKLRSTCEDCCDDLVVASRLSSGETYCRTLLDAAGVAAGAAVSGASFAYLSEPHPLARRFKRIMSAGFIPNPRLALKGLLLAAGLGLVFLPGIQPSSFRSQSPCPCEPSAEIRQALGSLPDLHDLRIPREQRLQPLRTIAEKYPDDIFVQSRLQDTFRGADTLYPEFDRAFALYRSKPDDPMLRYLEGRLTASFNARKAGEIFAGLIARDPACPWPHLAIVELTRRRGFRDTRKAEDHLRRVLAACPESPMGYALLDTVDDEAMLRSGAVKLRSLLEARSDTSSLAYWWSLWNLEFRVAPRDEQETVRRRILQDVARLQKLPPSPSPEWSFVFSAAHQLTGEDGILTWMDKVVRNQSPPSKWSPVAEWIEWMRWSRAHLPPAGGAGPEQRKAYQDLRNARARELSERWPDDPSPIIDKWSTLQFDETSPLDEKLASVDKIIQLNRMSPDWLAQSDPPFPIMVAELYIKWQARLDEIPELVNRGLQEAKGVYRYYPHPSMIPGNKADQPPKYDWDSAIRQRGNLILAEAYLRQKKLDLARGVIELGLAESNPHPPAQLEWLPLQGRLAELQGDAKLALDYYQKFLASMSRRIVSGEVQEDPPNRDRVADIKKLYLGNGGKEESWIEWATAGHKEEPATPAFLKIDYPTQLPEFETKDLSGKTWRLENLKGKATFIGILMALGGAQSEFARLQVIYDRIKDRPDLQLLAFCADDNSYLVESRVKAGKHTFPVIVSRTLTERLFLAQGLRRSCIVDALGRRSSAIRFSSPDLAIAELQKAAAAK